jgi:hypothetical protein
LPWKAALSFCTRYPYCNQNITSIMWRLHLMMTTNAQVWWWTRSYLSSWDHWDTSANVIYVLPSSLFLNGLNLICSLGGAWFKSQPEHQLSWPRF